MDLDDWMLNPTVLAELDKVWGPQTVGRLLVSTTVICQDLIVTAGNLVQKQSMPLLLIGLVRLTGGALQYL